MTAQLPEAHIIEQFAPDMTFDRFLATCQPQRVEHGMRVLLMCAGGHKIHIRSVDLMPVFFPDKVYRIFVGYDAVEQKWFYR